MSRFRTPFAGFEPPPHLAEPYRRMLRQQQQMRQQRPPSGEPSPQAQPPPQPQPQPQPSLPQPPAFQTAAPVRETSLQVPTPPERVGEIVSRLPAPLPQGSGGRAWGQPSPPNLPDRFHEAVQSLPARRDLHGREHAALPPPPPAPANPPAPLTVPARTLPDEEWPRDSPTNSVADTETAWPGGLTPRSPLDEDLAPSIAPAVQREGGVIQKSRTQAKIPAYDLWLNQDPTFKIRWGNLVKYAPADHLEAIGREVGLDPLNPLHRPALTLEWFRRVTKDRPELFTRGLVKDILTTWKDGLRAWHQTQGHASQDDTALEAEALKLLNAKLDVNPELFQTAASRAATSPEQPTSPAQAPSAGAEVARSTLVRTPLMPLAPQPAPDRSGERDYQANYLDNYARTVLEGDPEEQLQSQIDILRMRPDWNEGRLPFYRRVFFKAYEDQVQKQTRRAGTQKQLRKQLEINGNIGLSHDLHRAERLYQQRRADIITRARHRGGYEIRAALEDAEKAYASEQAGLIAKADQTLAAMHKLYDEWGRDQDTVEWRSLNDYPKKVREYASAHHLNADDVLYWLEYFRIADWDRPLEKGPPAWIARQINPLLGNHSDQSRVLPDGRITVHPSLYPDKDAYARAVMASGASDEAKAKALLEFPTVRMRWVRQVLPVLRNEMDLPLGLIEGVFSPVIGPASRAVRQRHPIGITFTQWQQKKFETPGNEAFKTLPEEEQALQYLLEMRQRPGFDKLMEVVTRSFIKGGGDAIASGLGSVGLVFGRVPRFGKFMSEVAADWSRQNDTLTAAQAAKGGEDNLALRTAGVMTGLIPQMGPGIMGGYYGGMKAMLIITGFSTAGQQYADTYRHLIDQGVPHDEAWNQVALPAVASGLVSTTTTLLGGRSGIEAIFRQRGQAGLRQAFQPVWKAFFKGAVKENLEEVPDELLNQISSALAKDRNADLEKVLADFIKRSPELLLAIGALGGAGEASTPKPANSNTSSAAFSQESTPVPDLHQQMQAAGLTVSMEGNQITLTGPDGIKTAFTSAEEAVAAIQARLQGKEGGGAAQRPVESAQLLETQARPTEQASPRTQEQEQSQANLDAGKSPADRFAELQRLFPNATPNQLQQLRQIAQSFGSGWGLSLQNYARKALGLDATHIPLPDHGGSHQRALMSADPSVGKGTSSNGPNVPQDISQQMPGTTRKDIDNVDAIPDLDSNQSAKITSLPKGDRPKPETYLSKEYIESHSKRFVNGASRIMSKRNLEKYGPAQRDGTSYVLPKEELDRILATVGNDVRALERALYVPAGSWDSTIVRVDVPHPERVGVRMPSGNEGGTNDQWIPGGKLPNGVPEAVVDLGNAPLDAWTSTEIN